MFLLFVSLLFWRWHVDIRFYKSTSWALPRSKPTSNDTSSGQISDSVSKIDVLVHSKDILVLRPFMTSSWTTLRMRQNRRPASCWLYGGAIKRDETRNPLTLLKAFVYFRRSTGCDWFWTKVLTWRKTKQKWHHQQQQTARVNCTTKGSDRCRLHIIYCLFQPKTAVLRLRLSVQRVDNLYWPSHTGNMLQSTLSLTLYCKWKYQYSKY